MSPEEIKAAYAMQYPELATAAIIGPEVVGGQAEVRISARSGFQRLAMRVPSIRTRREAVLDELTQLVEGRHPDCQSGAQVWAGAAGVGV
jgi:hypothetical protein